jgi:hypothetical protein
MATKNNPLAVSYLKEDDLIVITGAGGFIAGALARYFSEQGFIRIRAIDKKPLPEWYQRTSGVECLCLDLSNEGNCRRVCEGAVEVYNPLETKNLSSEWISRLRKSGKNCYAAIIAKDVDALGASMNECMFCWENILPGTVHHHKLNENLLSLLEYYRSNYSGDMYSGCGGGYLFVASQKPVPGAFHIKVRIKS